MAAKQFVDFFRVVVAFQRNETIADHLEMLFCFRLKKLQDLVRNLVVRRQRIESKSLLPQRQSSRATPPGRIAPANQAGKVQRWCLRWERKPIALFENCDIIDTLLACCR